MSGFVVFAGLFEPGTSVSLFAAQDGVLRSDGSGFTGRRLADAAGSVGFDGLTPGDRFIAVGVDLYSVPIEVVCRALAATDGSELAQAPITRVPQTVGYTEARPPVVRVGEPGAILHTGVPEGVPVGVALAA